MGNSKAYIFIRKCSIMASIPVQKTMAPKAKPTDSTKLGFGNFFTDHMFLMNYDEGEGWAQSPDCALWQSFAGSCRDVPALRSGSL